MDAQQMHEQLERLIAKEQIHEALLEYARGADRLDLERVRQTFHDGATVDYGEMFQGTGSEFADFLGRVHPRMQSHTHHLSNISIRVDGDRAGSECYVIMRARTLGKEGTKHDNVSYGRYVDRWERRDGVWRIVERRYLHSLDEIWKAEKSLFDVGGSRDASDPSFEALDPPGRT